VDLMKKSEIILALLGVSIALCLVTPSIQAAPTYTAGVSPNQVATYSYSGTTGYNNPTAIHIRSVSGSIVNYRRDSVTTDVAYDVSHILSYGALWFASENMGIGDQFQSGNAVYVVGAIVAKNFAGRPWSAVQLNASASGVKTNALFDQVTGLMLYYNRSQRPAFSDEDVFFLTSLAAEVEVPTTPVDPAWIIVMGIAGIGIAILIASRKMIIRQAIE
jgi:hypothetical protein